MFGGVLRKNGPRMTPSVRLSDDAEDDLFNLGVWIASRADRQTARDYLGRIEAACRRLASFPDRGSPREELGPGLRSVVFERRATIIYLGTPDEVVIVRIIHRGRDPSRFFEN